MDTQAFRHDVLLDITRLVWRRLHGSPMTGADRVGLAYVKHYGPVARAVVTIRGVVVVCHDGPSQTVFDWLLDVGSERAARRSLTASLLLGARKPTRYGAWLIDPGPGPGERRRWGRTLRRMGVRTLNVVHDLISVSHPQLCQSWEPAYHQRRISHALRTAHGIVCNSQCTLSQLQAFAADRQLPMPPAISASLAPELPMAQAGPRRIPQPYFVVLGDIEPRRNHQLLLQIWQRLHEHLGEQTPRLVLIGERGIDGEQVGRLLDRSPALRATVIEAGRRPADEIVSWLRHAQALLLPSLAEGFGIPLVEALSHGLPVIASDLSVFREQAGEIPEFIDPLDALGWMDRIVEYSEPGCAARARQLAMLRHYRPPTWVDHFQRIDDLMARIEQGEVALVRGNAATTMSANPEQDGSVHDDSRYGGPAFGEPAFGGPAFGGPVRSEPAHAILPRAEVAGAVTGIAATASDNAVNPDSIVAETGASARSVLPV